MRIGLFCVHERLNLLRIIYELCKHIQIVTENKDICKYAYLHICALTMRTSCLGWVWPGRHGHVGLPDLRARRGARHCHDGQADGQRPPNRRSHHHAGNRPKECIRY